MLPKTVLRSFFLFLLFTNSFQYSIAQGEGSVWYFGNGESINFNLGCEIMDNSSNAMYAPEGCVTVCDENGNVLFYSNGGGRNPLVLPGENPGYIWNKDHDVMLDMMGTQGGGWSATQSSVVVPKPNFPNIYYLFTQDEFEADLDANISRGVSLYEVDMTMNGGLGDVVSYDQSIVLKGTEYMDACQHTNGEFYWLAAYNEASEGINILSIDTNGVNFGFNQDTFDISNPFTGIFKFSPDGSKLWAGRTILDFDPSTGITSNPILIGDFDNSASFSPNSRYLFLSRTNLNSVDFFRFDMEASDVANSGEVIATYDGNYLVGQMQVAPDGNIYFVEINLNADNRSLSTIQCPNGDSPCVRQSLIPLENFSLPFLGLPNFTDHLFASDVVNVEMDICIDSSLDEICPGEEVILSASHYLADNFLWSNGDTGSSTIVTEPGIHFVTVSDGCCFESIAQIEILDKAPEEITVDIMGESTICENEVKTLTAISSTAESFEWSDGSISDNITITSVGTYTVTVTNICDEIATQEIQVTYTDPLDLEFGNIGDLPCGGEVELFLNSDGVEFEWSTGETSESIYVTELGDYYVTVSNGCETGVDSFSLETVIGTTVDIPNAFTPDGDGINDSFGPIWNCNEVNTFAMKIYNRWGQLIYDGQDPTLRWDGSYENSQQASDVFVYFITYTDGLGESFSLKGDVTLIR